MLLLVVFLCVIVALVLLVVSVVTATAAWAWGSVVASVLAAALLIADFRRVRRTAKGPASSAAGPSPATSSSATSQNGSAPADDADSSVATTAFPMVGAGRPSGAGGATGPGGTPPGRSPSGPGPGGPDRSAPGERAAAPAGVTGADRRTGSPMPPPPTRPGPPPSRPTGPASGVRPAGGPPAGGPPAGGPPLGGAPSGGPRRRASFGMVPRRQTRRVRASASGRVGNEPSRIADAPPGSRLLGLVPLPGTAWASRLAAGPPPASPQQSPPVGPAGRGPGDTARTPSSPDPETAQLGTGDLAGGRGGSRPAGSPSDADGPGPAESVTGAAAATGATGAAAAGSSTDRPGTDRAPRDGSADSPDASAEAAERPDRGSGTGSAAPANGVAAGPAGAAPPARDAATQGTGPQGTGPQGTAGTGPDVAAANGSGQAADPPGSIPGVDEPDEERADAADLEAVATLDSEVLVVDEEPRFHLGRCSYLYGREVIPLPVSEAVELGFTGCAWCTPVRSLADRRGAGSRS